MSIDIEKHRPLACLPVRLMGISFIVGALPQGAAMLSDTVVDVMRTRPRI